MQRASCPSRIRSAAMALAILVLFAGCSGSAKNAAVDAPPSNDSHEIDARQGSGMILGSVVDQELAPIEGVRVSVWLAQGTEPIEVHTNEEGRFTVRELDAGNYTLTFSQLRFEEPSPLVVQLDEGERRSVQVVMTPVPTPDPRHETFTRRYVGGILCWKGPEFEGCSGTGNIQPSDPTNLTNNRNTTIVVNENKVNTLQGLILEAQWTPTQTYCKFAVQFKATSPEGAQKPAQEDGRDPFRWSSPADPTSPIRYEIPREGTDVLAMHSAARTANNADTPIQIKGTWSVYSSNVYYPTHGTPIDLSCSLEQDVEEFVTLFWVDPAPEGFSVFEA